MENEIQSTEVEKEPVNNNYFKDTFLKNVKLNTIIIIISVALFII